MVVKINAGMAGVEGVRLQGRMGHVAQLDRHAVRPVGDQVDVAQAPPAFAPGALRLIGGDGAAP